MSVLGKYKWDFKWVLQEHNQAITQSAFSLL